MALLCSKCHKPIRKGQHMVITSFARHVGIEDGRAVSEPWLSVVVHMREECMSNLTPEVITEARKAGLRAGSTRPKLSGLLEELTDSVRALRDAPRDGTVDISALHRRMNAALAALSPSEPAREES